MSSSTFTSLTESHVYRMGDLLLEAALCEVWTLIVLTDKGEYVPRQHGALIAFQMRTDGLWDSIYDCHTPALPYAQAWCFAHGIPKTIDLRDLIYVAENRSVVQAEYQEQELEQNFLEIMAAMEW